MGSLLGTSFSVGIQRRHNWSNMSYSYSSHRITRSCSPSFDGYIQSRRSSLADHINSMIQGSKRCFENRATSLSPKFEEPIRMSSLICPPLSPWSKTGEFYYPRYPESWRGTASSTPISRDSFYWTNPARYYRYRSFYPRYYIPSRRYFSSRYYRWKQGYLYQEDVYSKFDHF